MTSSWALNNGSHGTSIPINRNASISYVTIPNMKTLFNLLSLSLSEELCNSRDKKVLLQIKKHFGDPYHLASWLPGTDCCTAWNQVECDPTTNRVVSLRIFSGNLSGEIPAEVGDMPYLKTLEFHKLTNITGPIPTSISKSYTSFHSHLAGSTSLAQYLTLLATSRIWEYWTCLSTAFQDQYQAHSLYCQKLIFVAWTGTSLLVQSQNHLATL